MALRTRIKVQKLGKLTRVITVAVQKLKREQILAKMAFFEQANYLTRALSRLVKCELQEEFSMLSFLAERVGDGNVKCRATGRRR